MKVHRQLWWLVLPALAGCNGAKAPVVTATKPHVEEEQKLFETPTTVPNLTAKHILHMEHLGRSLYVGDTEERVLQVFAAPPGSFEQKDLPDGWDKNIFRAKGWEKSGVGFSAIYKGDLMVLALYTQESVGNSDLKASQSLYEDAFGNSFKVEHGKTRYHFWESKGDRLMINVQSIGKSSRVAIALGDQGLMDALRMNKASAEADTQYSMKSEND